MRFFCHTNLQMYFPSLNFSSSSIFQTAIYKRMNLCGFLILHSHMSSPYFQDSPSFYSTFPNISIVLQILLSFEDFPKHPNPRFFSKPNSYDNYLLFHLTLSIYTFFCLLQIHLHNQYFPIYTVSSLREKATS